MARYFSLAILLLALAAVALANVRPFKTTHKPTKPQKLYKLTVSGARGCGTNLQLVCKASSQRLTGLTPVLSSVYTNGNNQVVKVLLQEQKQEAKLVTPSANRA